MHFIIYYSGLHENRPLHLLVVEPGNLVCSYWRSIRIVPIDYQSKCRDVYTAAQHQRCDVVVAWKKILLGGWAPKKVSKPWLLCLDLSHQSHLYIENTTWATASIPRVPPFFYMNTYTAWRPNKPHAATDEPCTYGDRTSRTRRPNTAYALRGLWWTSHSLPYPTAWTYPHSILSSSTPLAGGVHRGPRLGP